MSHKSKERQAQNILLPSSPKAMKDYAIYDHAEFERQFERSAARHEELRYRIAPDCKVHIQFNGIATQEAIRKLIGYLEIGIVDFPKDADKSATHE
jgi:hypothetical protein